MSELNDQCTCGHVADEHEGGWEFCLVELEDGTHCPCVHFDEAD